MIYIVLGVIVLIILYLVICYNIFVKLDNQVKEAFATMDVYLKKRWDLIPNVVEAVKGYANYEKDTLEEIVELRNKAYDALDNSAKIDVNGEISKDLDRLMAIAENYPDLKANENFLSLQKDLTHIEDEIAQSRKYYNATVRIFNNKVEMFPSNIVAKILGYKVRKMFEAAASEREGVKVEL